MKTMTPQTSARRSRIAHFKVPCIVSLAASSALGCGGKAEVSEQGGVLNVPLADNVPLEETGEGCPAGVACNPPPPERQDCPEVKPDPGTSCSGYVAELACEYPYCYGREPMVRCGADGAWEGLPLLSCNPPPPVVEPCPEAMPEPGSDCASEEQFCGYPGCQGPDSSTAACRHGQWLVEYSGGVVCNPPAVVPVCPSLEPTSGAGCAYDGQACSYGICGESSDAGRTHTCAFGMWQTSEPPCSSPDTGGVDAGADSGG
jgi:hypothetical protein